LEGFKTRKNKTHIKKGGKTGGTVFDKFRLEGMQGGLNNRRGKRTEVEHSVCKGKDSRRLEG